MPEQYASSDVLMSKVSPIHISEANHKSSGGNQVVEVEIKKTGSVKLLKTEETVENM